MYDHNLEIFKNSPEYLGLKVLNRDPNGVKSKEEGVTLRKKLNLYFLSELCILVRSFFNLIVVGYLLFIIYRL